jgi:4-diphosphocytidyl-2-C-methyl-D-erythritol kinase
MLCFPNAKINLGLNIISRRSDGYHNIETVFCPVGLSDILEFIIDTSHKDGHATFTGTGFPADCSDVNNLCVKAYYLLSRDFRLPAVNIHLHKFIPSGAGLGGGSSDAAFMLRQLNILFELGINEDRLCDYASKLGSDCAFFIKNRPLLGYERGNKFEEIPKLPESLHIAIVNPGIHVDTGTAYSFIQPRKPLHSLKECIGLPVSEWNDFIVNDFENGMIKKYPIIGSIKNRLYENGSLFASMSGSGSSVYGLFKEEVPDVQAFFPESFYWSGEFYREDNFTQ